MEYKILVVVAPFRGHLNPMTSFIRQLTTNNKNLKVIFPGNKAEQELIESTHAEFRHMELDVTELSNYLNKIREEFPVDKIMGKNMDMTRIMLPKLVDIVRNEDIDLIIYDFATVYGKYLIDHLDNLYAKGKLKKRPPQAFMFSPSIISSKDIYPNEAEKKFLMKPKMSIGMIVRLIVFAIRYIFFCISIGVKLHNPEEYFMYKKAKRNICCIIPEFQPRSHLVDKSVTFVGICADIDANSSAKMDDKLSAFLADIKPCNPLALKSNLSLDEKSVSIGANESKLIYVSFGTVFNRDIQPFLKIIQAFKNLEEQQRHKIKMLMSVGDETFNEFEKSIANKSLQIPDTILYQRRVPQIEILKRASLFITHSGQNSTSEAIHYGVPMVCLPVCGDQPLVAYRTCDELGLGIRLSLDDLTVDKIYEAISEIFNDKLYTERSSLFAKISHKYDGRKLASDVVIRYLQENSNSKK